jgi:hypothetical protein
VQAGWPYEPDSALDPFTLTMEQMASCHKKKKKDNPQVQRTRNFQNSAVQVTSRQF